MITTAQHHAIGRQVLDVAVDGTEAEGFALQGKLVALCRDWLTPALDAALARVAPGDEYLLIDRLDLDAGAFTLDTLERDFVDAVRTALEKQIRERSPVRSTIQPSNPGTERAQNGDADSRSRVSPHDEKGDVAFSRRTGGQATQDAFLHFLATGVLPWWFRVPSNETLETLVSAVWRAGGTQFFYASSTLRAIASSVARLRLVRQFSSPFLETLLKGLAPETARATEQIAQQLMAKSNDSGSRAQLLERLWRSAFEAVSQGREISATTLLDDGSLAFSPQAPTLPNENGDDALGTRARRPMSASPAQAKRAAATGDGELAKASPGIDLDEGVFVDSAGIVLLHPFLLALFERLGVASDGALIEADRALALLHFLATRETHAPEYALLLPKLLCGLPLDEPVGAPVDLTEDEIAEAEGLLVAVIGHWTALGDASPDALRGTFLTRPGKLSRRDGDDLLQIEPQSFDVLLDRLPWGIGAIRLPWMGRMLWVEWRV